MCLFLDERATARVAKRKSPIKAWKMYKVEDGVLYPPIWNCGKVEIEPDGTVRSDRKSKDLAAVERQINEVHHGIHVSLKTLTTVPPAAAWTRLDKAGNVYIRIIVECAVADFVAAERRHLLPKEGGGFFDDAVFTKVKVPPDIIQEYPRNLVKIAAKAKKASVNKKIAKRK